MNPEDDDTNQDSPESGEQHPVEYQKKNSVVEVIVMIIIFGVLVLLVLGTCFLG